MSTEFNFYKFHELLSDVNVVMSYKGPVSPIIISEFSKDIRTKFAEQPRASKKIFAIYMELAENIFYYSSERIKFDQREDGVGTIVISESPEFYTLYCGNYVKSEKAKKLETKCLHINTLNRDQLREYKREQRNSPKLEDHKGAGIGLIHTALTANSKLSVEFIRVNEQFTFFSLAVNIKKSIQNTI